MVSHGVLPDAEIRRAIERGFIEPGPPLHLDQIQPASLDLRLGDIEGLPCRERHGVAPGVPRHRRGHRQSSPFEVTEMPTFISSRGQWPDASPRIRPLRY